MSNKAMVFCQSCCMPLEKEEDLGTNADGTKNQDYCTYCYANGEFSSEGTMEEMIESCLPHVSNGNPWPDEATARAEMLTIFPTLKRWQKA